MSITENILAALGILCVIVALGMRFIFNDKEQPVAKRKWTDPKDRSRH